MAERSFKADGERWVVGIDDRAVHPGMRALVFHCVSNSGRPFRVLEVPITGSEPDLPDDKLREYFAAAHSMGYTTDRSAEGGRHGGAG